MVLLSRSRCGWFPIAYTEPHDFGDISDFESFISSASHRRPSTYGWTPVAQPSPPPSPIIESYNPVLLQPRFNQPPPFMGPRTPPPPPPPPSLPEDSEPEDLPLPPWQQEHRPARTTTSAQPVPPPPPPPPLPAQHQPPSTLSTTTFREASR
ncbi:hypothetical protein HPB47_021581 [Ixodes persulcatus]|uniref:Uncharacterized protein n=1 Tax=Ixodes persulcatus TaxID=34615 RepID=A0AC60QC35_IXOPE|nr:hypothetical protein HPB47_021581 [Ixodes persulcatus]